MTEKLVEKVASKNSLRAPTIKDIARLLLLCAPKDVLLDYELSEEKFDEFCEDYDFEYLMGSPKGQMVRIDLIAVAFYHANKNIVNSRKSTAIMQSLYIEPSVIGLLIKFARCEGWAETEELLTHIEREKKSKAAGKRHKEHRDMKRQAVDYYKSNFTDFNNKDEAALFISQKIMPAAFSTVRGWLKNVQPE